MAINERRAQVVGPYRRITVRASQTLLPPTSHAARTILWIMIAINFFNYVDRIIFAAVGPELKRAFHLTDGQIGMTGSAFILVYAVSALPLGLVADRHSRTKVIAIGVALWSLATWYTSIASNLPQLFLGRAVLGIGEASYIPAGIALLAAYYAPSVRASVMSRWGASTLVGTAVGFILGGVIAQHVGWRFAFVLCAIPGLVLAVFAWRMQDRPAYDEADRHARNEVTQSNSQSAPTFGGVRGAFAFLVKQVRLTMRSPTVRICICIQAMGLFVVTPSIIFIPIYLREHFHLSIQTTALLAGGVLIPGGVLGTILGGKLADALSKRYAGGRMMTVAIGFAFALPCYIAAFLVPSLYLLLPLAFLATAFMNMYSGPMNAITQDVVPSYLRASAAGVIMTLAHLLGDVASPTLIGSLTGNVARHHGHHAVQYVARMNIAQALVLCSAPVLTMGALLAVWAVHIYAREMAASDSDTDYDLAQNKVALAQA